MYKTDLQGLSARVFSLNNDILNFQDSEISKIYLVPMVRDLTYLEHQKQINGFLQGFVLFRHSPSPRARTLRAASAVFRSLMRLWRHTSVSQIRKLSILKVVDLPKLLYALAATWLNTAERRRSDGLQSRCLRTIWGIKAV